MVISWAFLGAFFLGPPGGVWGGGHFGDFVGPFGVSCASWGLLVPCELPGAFWGSGGPLGSPRGLFWFSLWKPSPKCVFRTRAKPLKFRV